MQLSQITRLLRIVFVTAVAMTSATALCALPADDSGPIVHADRRVTFRLTAPDASEVLLILEGAGRRAMQRQENGDWRYVTEPLQPDLYNYYFAVDGALRPDPGNPAGKPVVSGGHESIVHVPGPASLPWEKTADTPHGTVHRHEYHSKAANEVRDLWVYTPPGYDAAPETKYPVLYLLHGVSDDARAWTTAGRADIILDNLIHRRQAKPMIVVMPLGYGFPDPAHNLSRAFAGQREQREIMQAFAGMVIGEIVPLVEAEYRVAADRDSRAIAGLSMGGSQAVYIGLHHPDHFGWVGSFSGAFIMYGADFDGWFPEVEGNLQPKPRLFWRSIGTEDFLLDVNRRFGTWLEDHGVVNKSVEIPGGHTWSVFRRSLAAFAPMLFQKPQ